MKQIVKPADFPIQNKFNVKIAFGKANTRRIAICISGLYAKSLLFLFGLIICQAFSNTIAAQHFSLEALDAIASEKKTMQLLDAAENWYMRNSDSARSYSSSALQMAQYLKNDSLIAKGHRIIGISHYYSGNFMLFAEHSEYGLETKYASNNRDFAAKLWNNLGIAYEMLDDFENAICAYNKSMELERLIQNESE